MEHMKDTQWDFALVLRQKYQEKIFRRRLKELGVNLEAPVELIQVHVDETVCAEHFVIIFLPLIAPRVIAHWNRVLFYQMPGDFIFR